MRMEIVVNRFKDGRNSKVLETVPIEEIFEQIKNPRMDYYNKVIELREKYIIDGQKTKQFNEEKLKLDSVRFNFLFNKTASNSNIKASTGLIYIDVDDCIEIDENNPYIFAKWLSVSGMGMGILVKVKGLTKENFKQTYIEVAKLLGIKSDDGACKATQQTMLGIDFNLKVYPTEFVFDCRTLENGAYSGNKSLSSPIIGVNAPFLEKQVNTKYRFNNIDSFFVGDKENKSYLVFDKDKQGICNPFIPSVIEEGKRNQCMYFVLTQYALLNKDFVNFDFLKACANTVNDRFTVPYSDDKVNSIVRSVLESCKDGKLTLYENEFRRVLFNPKMKIPTKEKQQITASIMGGIRFKQTDDSLYSIIESWDFDKHGKITQIKVAELAGKSRDTVKRHWEAFKDYVKELNNNYKTKQNEQRL